jgi:hypothetical protein
MAQPKRVSKTPPEHNKGEIKTTIPCNIDGSPARKVNCLRSYILDIEYYVADNKIFKKLKSGKYRELVLQNKNPWYVHYFLRDKDHRKLTVSVKKLKDLTFAEPEFLTEEKGNESEQLSTESGTKTTETEVDKTGEPELKQ